MASPIAVVTQVCTGNIRADTDNVAGRSDGAAGCKTQGRVPDTGSAVKQRSVTAGRVSVASGVGKQRINTAGRVGAAGGVVKERSNTVGRIEAASRVALQGLIADGGV
jgi:hypothetical protein